MKHYRKLYEDSEYTIRRNERKFRLLVQWMRLKNRNICLLEFFNDHNINSVAIYGMGEIGKLLYTELNNERNIVKYGLDKYTKAEGDLPVYKPMEAENRVDAIIVTPVLIEDSIEDMLYDVYGECTMYTFEEVLYELSRKYMIPSELWTTIKEG